MPHVVEPPATPPVEGDTDLPIYQEVARKAAAGNLGKEVQIPRQPTVEDQSAEQDGDLHEPHRK